MGARAGVPTSAATCDVVGVLRDYQPSLASVAEDPHRALLPVGDRLAPRRPYVRVDSGYQDLVERGIDVGLIEEAPDNELEQVAGAVMYGGAFAVPKDRHEDRWIAPSEYVNDIIDQRQIPETLLPYLPQ